MYQSGFYSSFFADFGYLFYANHTLAFFGFLFTLYFVPKCGNVFEQVSLTTIDALKPRDKKVPAALGIVSSLIYIVCMILFIPILYVPKDFISSIHYVTRQEVIPDYASISGKCNICYLKELIPYCTTLFCISLMAMLGFVDDVLALKRRHKLWLPCLVSLAHVIVYFTCVGKTVTVVPQYLHWLLGKCINWGALFYVYLCLLSGFCANAIGLMSGLNGVATGQCITISISIILHNLIELSGPDGNYHKLSLYFMIPFLSTTIALHYYSKYPARVFVGDSFCFTAGMLFSVVAVQGHFTETLVLFFMPQIFNFVYALPQILRLLPYPQRRNPRYNPYSGTLVCSRARFKKREGTKAMSMILAFYQAHNLIILDEQRQGREIFVEFNNLTMSNYLLLRYDAFAMTESELADLIISIQIKCCLMGFVIRYTVGMLA